MKELFSRNLAVVWALVSWNILLVLVAVAFWLLGGFDYLAAERAREMA